MATQAELKTSIASLDAKIASGIRSTTVDGTTVSVDINTLKSERTKLQRRLDRLRRPNAYGFVRAIDLGGF